MHDSQLNSARRAQRILDAWEHQDLPGLQAELRFAQRACATISRACTEEQERLELLDGIAARMEQDLVRTRLGNGDSASTCFRLLMHLATNRPYVAIRSERLSSFPYSQSVRKISACR